MSSTPSRSLVNGYHRGSNGLIASAPRGASMTRESAIGSSLGGTGSGGDDEDREEDPIHLALKQRWETTQANIAALFSDVRPTLQSQKVPGTTPETITDTRAETNAKTSAPFKKAARTIDDDYGDDDDDDEEDETDKESPLKSKGKQPHVNGISPLTGRSPAPITKPPAIRTSTTMSQDNAKPSAEDARRQLEMEKKANADAAKRSFQTMFYTLENDRDAMLEQQKLDELDREVENEISGDAEGNQSNQQNASGTGGTQGSLGSADLGASSLTLKHLIARIDAKRDMVQASDNQLRTLISEVRKGRSKWASEEKVGQEELYEAAEKVLMELKAMTEYAQPFLQRVAKRDAPDYYQIIKQPMDIGTMIKKLKQLSYKSKKDFVDDLNLIWSNCLKYNTLPELPIRKKALYMRKETDKLTPLIPEIVVRDRAEVEADERRQQSLDADDDSDDDDAPIMASRGHKAPKKGSKGAPSSARQALPTNVEDASTPASEVKPALPLSTSALRNEFLRADSETNETASAGLSTPPPGSGTPLVNGVSSVSIAGGQTDPMDVDGTGQSTMIATAEDADEDDAEFKTWKQVTKKDRATIAADRNRLFRGNQLNPDEPALLRDKAMMRRWIRLQKVDLTDKSASTDDVKDGAEGTEVATGETLAEGIEEQHDSTLPDYYHTMSAIPALDDCWKWATDSEGFVVPQSDKWMRMYPKNQYKSAEGVLTKRIESNMRQMQDTRKICSKIGIVKQMQIQGQTYSNQFQKYDPEPFLEKDIGPVVVSEDGPLMTPWVNRAAMQRAVGKIFYHAGFEDFQPSALDTVTDIANEYFTKLVQGLKAFQEQPKIDAQTSRFTYEEQVLHSLDENGTDIEALESYVKDDVERLSTKLTVMHERMKSHLGDLLRPALGDHVGADGAGAFNDGSDQFVGGDFAEEMGEDFFGFRELGLADELGLEALSVPFHLLQNRMHNAYQAQHQGPVSDNGIVFPQPAPYDPITIEMLPRQIGIIQDFFRAKLRTNHENPLVEDEDLPQKQRFPKPRLPPTGKISSPRKRPIREQQQLAKKKRKLEESEEKSKLSKPIGPLRLEMPDRMQSGVDPEKDGEGNASMMSPESITGH
ncbi:Hypothetical protein R9X50_00334800 [Acrodontium crateriforme]|uniref:SAGA complex subunit Spt7 n=1 Tax=Acrodontium crateriforme TaxID=150365 RepID=A0AAQ3M376_9PEZI|nr:Hypothetical protein R9X50_00334800 [Acrodontium crateriforme]